MSSYEGTFKSNIYTFVYGSAQIKFKNDGEVYVKFTYLGDYMKSVSLEFGTNIKNTVVPFSISKSNARGQNFTFKVEEMTPVKIKGSYETSYPYDVGTFDLKM